LPLIESRTVPQAETSHKIPPVERHRLFERLGKPVRFTYEAHVATPKNVMALMSADNDPKAARDGDYSFQMPQAIPSYLMAIAAGDLVFRPVSERAGVWAEPAMADKAAKEFEDTEKMIVTAEALYGPYRWGRYDILVLPPSFPFGGMENPRLTFATPTVIVGDKSLVSIIAHELAHSWSGNLVTNSSWKDMWLNEGFTSYVENRITEVMYNPLAGGYEFVELHNASADTPLALEGVAFTDGIAMGLDLPVRMSADIKGTPGCIVLGPKGHIELKEGVIRAQRHAHMHTSDAEYYGVKSGDFMRLKVHGSCPTVFEGVICRVSKDVKLEVHLDTDEGNASDLANAARVELEKM